MVFPIATINEKDVTPHVERLLKIIEGEQSRSDLQGLLNITDRGYFTEKYLITDIEMGFVERTIPDKPKSTHQKYRLTLLGKEVINTELSS